MKKRIILSLSFLIVALLAFSLGGYTASLLFVHRSIQRAHQDDFYSISWAYKTHRALVEGRISDATKIQEMILGMYLSSYNDHYNLPGRRNSFSNQIPVILATKWLRSVRDKQKDPLTEKSSSDSAGAIKGQASENGTN